MFCFLMIDFANQVEKIRNVVFMGMGEPLDNYDAVISAIKSMTDTSKFGLSPCRISVSTVGVVPRIKQLSQDMPMVGLALSLHAPTQELRQQIVPTSKAWHIDRIMHVVKQFIDNQNKDIKSTNRRRHVLVEYVIIKDINDSATTAHALGKLLKDMDILLNIIPYNPTAVPYDYKPPNANVCKEFVEITRNYGLHVLYRQEMGSDISSACGQLVIESRGCDSGDIEDVGKSTGGRKKPVKKGRVIKAMTEIVENDEKSLGHWMPELLTGVALSVSAILVYRLVCKYATRS